MYWQSQGKHGLSAKANKGSERASMFEYMHTLFVALHQSTSVSDSNYFVCFQQMRDTHIWIFTHKLLWQFGHFALQEAKPMKTTQTNFQKV